MEATKVRIRVEVEMEVDDESLDRPEAERPADVPDDLLRVTRVTVSAPANVRTAQVRQFAGVEPGVTAYVQDGLVVQVERTAPRAVQIASFQDQARPWRMGANILSLVAAAGFRIKEELDGLAELNEDDWNAVRNRK